MDDLLGDYVNMQDDHEKSARSFTGVIKCATALSVLEEAGDLIVIYILWGILYLHFPLRLVRWVDSYAFNHGQQLLE